MIDLGLEKMALIGVVALIVIGPKELPGVMRTLGQWTRKVRGMAADFQNQFQEAMREAEMTDLKKQVDDMTHFDPLKDVKSGFDDMKSSLDTVGKDLQASVESKPAEASTSTSTVATGLAATVAPAAETRDAASLAPSPADEAVPAPEAAAAAVPEAVQETANETPKEAGAAESTGRGG